MPNLDTNGAVRRRNVLLAIGLLLGPLWAWDPRPHVADPLWLAMLEAAAAGWWAMAAIDQLEFLRFLIQDVQDVSHDD